MHSPIRHSPFRIRHLAATLLLAPCALLPAAPPPELTLLRTQYEKVLAEKVTAPFDAAKADLDAKFTAALDRIADEAKKEGKLDAVLAILEDKKRLANKFPLPDDDDATPDSLKKLRGIYREQLTKLEEQRTANHAAILPSYTAKLQALETTLTKADRIDEAKEVMTYREGLAAGAGETGPTAPAGAGAKLGMSRDSRRENNSTAKGDDRAAAEFVIGLGGKVKIAGVNDFITSVDALPKKRFSLYDINLSTNGKGTLEEADADKLSGLRELVFLTINNSVKSDEALRFLPTCPNLIRVHVENCGELQGSWLKYAAPLKKLETLAVVSGAKSDTSGIEAFQSENLASMNLRAAAADDNTMAAVGRFKKLRNITLRDTKVTDAGMAYLSGLKNLVGLQVHNTAVTMAGMKPLGSAPLVTLGFGRRPDDMAAALPQLGAQFPKVEQFFIPGGGKMSGAHVSAIAAAWPKLRKLEFPSYMDFEEDAFADAGHLFPEVTYLYLWQDKATDHHVEELAKMKKLATLNLEGSQITDASLSALEKQKSLKTLVIRNTAVTDAALAAFKKARPDVKVEK
ncbi:MAG: hypothetical protein K1X78_16840 [Verrucomicrobiaceae bacterium]|nr:hypothetical protein [Verrucomicrobiaceae bacterium]